jgi:hypothetical protein
VSLCVLGTVQSADVMAQAWRVRGHRVLRHAIERERADEFAQRLQGAVPALLDDIDALLWIDEPLPPRTCAALARAAAPRPFIDLGWTVRPIGNALAHRALVAQVSVTGLANPRYVTCVLPAVAQPDRESGALPAVLVCSDDASAKAFASALLEALGRRTLDPGPLQSLRYLDPHTMRMYTEA